MHRAVRNDSAIGNRPSGASRHGGVSIGLSPFFSGGGGGVDRFYTVCEMNTHACVLINSLFVLKKRRISSRRLLGRVFLRRFCFSAVGVTTTLTDARSAQGQ